MVNKPSKPEDEYFKKLEEEKIKELREKLNKERENVRREREKQIHWMKCPKCGSDLKEEEMNKVMIDRCTSCGGIWLDKGELELIIKGEENFLNSLFNLLKRK